LAFRAFPRFWGGWDRPADAASRPLSGISPSAPGMSLPAGVPCLRADAPAAPRGQRLFQRKIELSVDSHI